MTSTADKMQTDYLWVREHSDADSWAKSRTHGYNYLYYQVPNKRERLEMIYRSLGKQYDWELGKWAASKKAPDRGNKKRFFKNVWRFIKHPLGYTYWKTARWRLGRGRLQGTTFSIAALLIFIKYKRVSLAQAKRNHFIQVSGENVQGSGLTPQGFEDQHLARQVNTFHSLLYYHIPANKIVVNPCKTQNFRKYFELRKKNGILPSNIQPSNANATV